ncbi:MAG TPA: PilN domain-containing protein [Nevskiales bacterium]|nr:PilN domain-containing protein [Nevskiales bacterium]
MLIKINLLDWRAELREKRKRQFTTAIAGALVASVGVVLLGMLYMNRAIENQQERNRILRDEIALIEKQIKEIEELEKIRANLLARMQVIEQLQQSRAQIVHYFDELVNTVPEGVYLTSVKQQGNSTSIDGVAESNSRVSAYMKNLDASPWFADPRLQVIKTGESGGRRLANFSLQVTEVNPNATPSEGGAAP